MKRIIFVLTSILLLISCQPEKNDDKTKVQIIYKNINREFVLIQDVQVLQQSNDAVSQHVDSILSGLISAEFISTGQRAFDLTGDGTDDIMFEIIDLNLFNPQHLPDYLDSLAARVIPLNLQILDNSTYHYPDALTEGVSINENGNWISETGVLGTFMNAGQFQGKGNRFLALRLIEDNKYCYGWLRMYCSQHNDTLRIIDFAYNRNGESIKAGQDN